jgi:hypothetical protein
MKTGSPLLLFGEGTPAHEEEIRFESQSLPGKNSPLPCSNNLIIRAGAVNVKSMDHTAVVQTLDIRLQAQTERLSRQRSKKVTVYLNAA